MSRAVLVWGAVVGGRRQHVFVTSSRMSPPGPPTSLCNTARSPQPEIQRPGDVPRCLRCTHLAQAWLADGRATAGDAPEDPG